MNWKIFIGGNRRAALKGAAGVAFVGLLLLVSPLGNPLADLSFDFPFLLRAEVPASEVAMIYMDDESHGVLEQPTFERWNRQLHGQLIDRLMDYRPRAVVFDIWFGGRTTNDAVLLAAIARATNAGIPVILAGTAETPSYKGAELGVKILPPFKQVGVPLTADPPLEDQLMWGVVQVGVGRDRTRREIFRNPGPEPTIAELVARLTRPGWTNDTRARRWLNYYGPPGQLDYFSYHRVLDSEKAIPLAALSNKVVFVGANVGLSFTGGTRTDHFATPWSWFRDEKFPGVDLNATAYLNLANRDWLTRMSPGLELLVVVCGGLALGAGLVQCRPYVATTVALAAAAVVALSACALVWRSHVWFAWLIIAGVQVPLALGWSVLAYTRRLAAEKARLETQLSGALATAAAPARQIIPVRMAGAPVTPLIPDHTLLRLVGKGAYGEIWLARNAIGTYHAVKILHRVTFPSEEPFEREFKGIQKFMPISRAHPGLVHVLHVGRNEEGGYIYYVMETADDETTGQSIDPVNYSPRNLSREISLRGRLPAEECVRLGLQLTAALHHLHSCGLIHRDIKPANIIFVNGAAKFADIGLVTEIAGTGREVTYVGTEGYMPPEGPGKPGADVFSLGKVLYVACTGMACSDFPALPEGVRAWPDCDQAFELNEIVLKACHEDAAKRYQTAAEMRMDLERLQQRRTAMTAG